MEIIHVGPNLTRESLYILVKAFLKGAKKKSLKSLAKAVQHCCQTFQHKLSFPPTADLFMTGPIGVGIFLQHMLEYCMSVGSIDVNG